MHVETMHNFDAIAHKFQLCIILTYKTFSQKQNKTIPTIHRTRNLWKRE